MYTILRRRSLVAVLTALACLVLMATPAAATTHDATITGGEITFSKTGMTPQAFDLMSATCTVTPTLQLDVTGTDVNVTALNMVNHDFIILPPNTYLSVFTRSTIGNSAGTLSGSTVTSLRFAVVVTTYNTSGCTPTGTPICTLAFLLHVGGTLTGTGVSDTFSFTGATASTVVTFPTCSVGPSYIVGTTGTVTSPITGHLTT